MLSSTFKFYPFGRFVLIPIHLTHTQQPNKTWRLMSHATQQQQNNNNQQQLLTTTYYYYYTLLPTTTPTHYTFFTTLLSTLRYYYYRYIYFLYTPTLLLLYTTSSCVAWIDESRVLVSSLYTDSSVVNMLPLFNFVKHVSCDLFVFSLKIYSKTIRQVRHQTELLATYMNDGFSHPCFWNCTITLSCDARTSRSASLDAMWRTSTMPVRTRALKFMQILGNLNLWITPDEYHEEGNGGLRVYLKKPPLDWTPDMSNDFHFEEMMMEFLSDAEYRSYEYRQNRFVMFNSRLFHKTETFRFKDCYRCRRINLTFLFGDA